MKYQWVQDQIQLQKNLYGSDDFDWVVLTVAGIIEYKK